MRNLKKLLAILLAAAMLLSFGSIASAAPVASYSEETQAKIQDAGEFLQMLGIVGSGDLNLDRTLTRAEMATILYWMVNSNAMNAAVEAGLKELKVFNDVSNEWYTPYINWANQENLMAGTGGNNFSPFREVTGVEAVILMAKVLGIDPSIDKDLKGKPWNEAMIPMLLKAESWFGLPGDFNVDLNKDLTRGEIFMIFKKALDGVYVEYSNDGLVYFEAGVPHQNMDGYYYGNINSGSGQIDRSYPLTQLQKVYGWTKVTGVVMANEFVCLDSSIRRYDWTTVEKDLPKTGNVTVGVYGRDFNSANNAVPISWEINGYYDVPLPEDVETVLDKYSWLAQEIEFYARVDAKTEQITKMYSPEIKQTGRSFTSERTSNSNTQADQGTYGKINNKNVVVDWLNPKEVGTAAPTYAPTNVGTNDKYSFIYNGTRFTKELHDRVKGDGAGGGSQYNNFVSPAAYANGSGWVFTRTEWVNRWDGANDYARSVGYAFRPTLAKVKATSDTATTFARLDGATAANLDFGSFFWYWDGSGNVKDNNKAYAEREIKAENIVEGAELLETDALVGVIPVGNGKYVVIETEEEKSVAIARIGDGRYGSDYTNPDNLRYNRAVGYGTTDTQIWFNAYGSVATNFRKQILDGEAMTNYRIVKMLNEIVLAERLNDVIFYGAVIASTPGATNPYIDVLRSDGVNGRYRLNLAGYSGNIDSRWELDVANNRIRNGSTFLPLKKDDATIPNNTPVMIQFRLDGDVATIEKFDALNVTPATSTDKINNPVLLARNGGYNGTYSWNSGIGSNRISFQAAGGTGYGSGSYWIGSDRIFAFYNNSISVLTEAQLGLLVANGGAQYANNTKMMVVDSRMAAVAYNWGPVYVATTEANITDTNYGYEQVGPGNYIRKQKAINLRTGEEETLTFRWNNENTASGAINNGLVARKGQVFQTSPNADNVVLMYNETSVDRVRMGADIQGWVFVSAPAQVNNPITDGYRVSGNVLNVFGRDYNRVGGTDMPVITMAKDSDGKVNTAAKGSLSDVSNAYNKSPKWPIIVMYHQDDIDNAKRDPLIPNTELLMHSKIYSVLAPTTADNDWTGTYDNGRLRGIDVKSFLDIVDPVVAPVSMTVVPAATTADMGDAIPVTVTARNAAGTAETTFNGVKTLKVNFGAAGISVRDTNSGTWVDVSGNQYTEFTAYFTNGVATLEYKFEDAGTYATNLALVGPPDMWGAAGAVTITVVDPAAAVDPYEGMTEQEIADEVSAEFTVLLEAAVNNTLSLAQLSGGVIDEVSNEFAAFLDDLLTNGVRPTEAFSVTFAGWLADAIANLSASTFTAPVRGIMAGVALATPRAAAAPVVKVGVEYVDGTVYVIVYVLVGTTEVKVVIPEGKAEEALNILFPYSEENAYLYEAFDVEAPVVELTDAEKVAAAIEAIEALEVTTEELAFDADAEAIEAAVIEAVEAAIAELELDEAIEIEVAFDGDETVTVTVTCGEESDEAELTVTIARGEEPVDPAPSAMGGVHKLSVEVTEFEEGEIIPVTITMYKEDKTTVETGFYGDYRMQIDGLANKGQVEDSVNGWIDIDGGWKLISAVTFVDGVATVNLKLNRGEYAAETIKIGFQPADAYNTKDQYGWALNAVLTVGEPISLTDAIYAFEHNTGKAVKNKAYKLSDDGKFTKTEESIDVSDTYLNDFASTNLGISSGAGNEVGFTFNANGTVKDVVVFKTAVSVPAGKNLSAHNFYMVGAGTPGNLTVAGTSTVGDITVLKTVNVSDIAIAAGDISVSGTAGKIIVANDAKCGSIAIAGTANGLTVESGATTTTVAATDDTKAKGNLVVYGTITTLDVVGFGDITINGTTGAIGTTPIECTGNFTVNSNTATIAVAVNKANSVTIKSATTGVTLAAGANNNVGNVNISGNVGANGVAIAAGSGAQAGTVTISGTVGSAGVTVTKATGNVTISGNVTTTGNVAIAQTGTGNVTISGTVAGTLQIATAGPVGDVLITKKITGATTIGASGNGNETKAAKSVTVSGDGDVAGNITVHRTTSGTGAVSIGKAGSTGVVAIDFAGDVTLGTTGTITGAVTLAANGDVGAVNINGNLTAALTVGTASSGANSGKAAASVTIAADKTIGGLVTVNRTTGAINIAGKPGAGVTIKETTGTTISGEVTGDITLATSNATTARSIGTTNINAKVTGDLIFNAGDAADSIGIVNISSEITGAITATQGLGTVNLKTGAKVQTASATTASITIALNALNALNIESGVTLGGAATATGNIAITGGTQTRELAVALGATSAGTKVHVSTALAGKALTIKVTNKDTVALVDAEDHGANLIIDASQITTSGQSFKVANTSATAGAGTYTLAGMGGAIADQTIATGSGNAVTLTTAWKAYATGGTSATLAGVVTVGSGGTAVDYVYR